MFTFLSTRDCFTKMPSQCVTVYQFLILHPHTSLFSFCGLTTGRTQLINSEHAPDIPVGWYDCGHGIYNPENRVIYTYTDSAFVRNADIDEHEWIVKTCRKGVNPEDQLSKDGLFN